MKQFKSRPNKDFTLIGDEWSQEDNPNYSCSWCNRILSRLIDSSGQNPCYYCNHCQIQFEPSQTQIRKKSKLGTQRNDVEPAVTSIQTDQSKSVEIRHEPELRGAFAAMAKKGTIRFTHYEDSSQR